MGAAPAPIRPLDALFRPRSVAVVGASNDPLKFGGRIARNIESSRIEARYYVNPGAGEILGQPAYAGLAELPEVPHAVVLALPADASLAALAEAGALGVRAAVVFAAGFGEAGEAGRARERQLAAIARRHGMAVLGPNCVGLANFAEGIFLSTQGGATGARPGPAALIAQSGSLAMAASSRQDGRFRYRISTGNEAALRAADLLAHLVETDAELRCIGLMLETIHDRHALAAAAAAARARGRRVILLKLASSGASGRIAALHTGAISGDRAPLEAFCAAHDILLADSLRSFNAAMMLLSATGYAGGRRLGIFTTSGGTAVLSADLATSQGLVLPEPSPAACAEIAELLGTKPEHVVNPLDTTGIHAADHRRFARALDCFARSGCFDFVLVPLGGAGGRIAAERVAAMIDVIRASPVPIVPVWQHQRWLEEEGFRRLYESGLAMATDFESPIEAMALIAGAAPVPGTGAPQAGAASMDLIDGLADLARFGVPAASGMVVAAGTDPAAILARLGTPVALKASHPALLHKSDSGMVAFPIVTADQCAAALVRMRQAITAQGLADARILAQAGIPGGIELLCGCVRDVEMGPYAVLAAGGIYTEILRDTAVVLLEPDAGLEDRIAAALRRLRIWPVLAGARGRAAYDTPAAIRAMATLARYFLQSAAGAMEVNPLIVLPEARGAVVVDARILR